MEVLREKPLRVRLGARRFALTDLRMNPRLRDDRPVTEVSRRRIFSAAIEFARTGNVVTEVSLPV